MEHTGAVGFGADAPLRVQALTARNLQLLQAIEGTLAALSADMRLFDAVIACFEEILKQLKAQIPEVAVDPDGEASNALVLAAESAQRMHMKTQKLYQHACDDPRLTADDGVADAYKERMTALERVFDTVEALREWIETHDALLAPVSGKTYKNVDDLFVAMGL